MTRLVLTLLLATAAGAAGAAGPIYRCGADGRTYSQVPCAEGTVVESSDPRTAAQRAEVRRAVAAERKATADLERARKESERATPVPAVAGTLGPVPAKPASAPDRGPKKTGKGKGTQSKDFVAVVPGGKAPAARK